MTETLVHSDFQLEFETTPHCRDSDVLLFPNLSWLYWQPHTCLFFFCVVFYGVCTKWESYSNEFHSITLYQKADLLSLCATSFWIYWYDSIPIELVWHFLKYFITVDSNNRLTFSRCPLWVRVWLKCFEMHFVFKKYLRHFYHFIPDIILKLKNLVLISCGYMRSKHSIILF